MVEDHADHALAMFKTQRDAIQWAQQQGHEPTGRPGAANDKKISDHWRKV